VAPIDSDLVFLTQLKRILDEQKSELEILELIYEYIYDGHFNKRAKVLRDPGTYEDHALNRVIILFSLIVPRYVQLFQNPHGIPVTHSQKQKNLAIHLDQQFKKALWEKVKRAKVPGLLGDDGLPIKDPFLDEPILFMKQDARSKLFPKNKRGDIVNLQSLVERFAEKLTAKGICLDDIHETKTPRFEYGP
jgi:hypothetical protein